MNLCAVITLVLPKGNWHSLTHTRTLKDLNKDAVAKLLALNAALKMIILFPPKLISLLSEKRIYVNNSWVM